VNEVCRLERPTTTDKADVGVFPFFLAFSLGFAFQTKKPTVSIIALLNRYIMKEGSAEEQ
jgi:hypothetical protein